MCTFRWKLWFTCLTKISWNVISLKFTCRFHWSSYQGFSSAMGNYNVDIMKHHPIFFLKYFPGSLQILQTKYSWIIGCVSKKLWYQIISWSILFTENRNVFSDERWNIGCFLFCKISDLAFLSQKSIIQK